MRILHCGDVVGKSGRAVIEEEIPRLRDDLALDAVVVCGENAAHGFGITPKICQAFFDAGVDVITTGNHAWDQREIIPYIDQEPRLIRPLNLPVETPGRGLSLHTLSDGRRLLVVQVMGRLFMAPVDDPWAALEETVLAHPLGQAVDAIVVDVHGEATSEKTGIAQFLDGQVSLVVGTHSHVPTADARIFSKGTAFQTDAGMCGPYDSVIGMVAETAVDRMRGVVGADRLEPADNPATLCGVYVETDDKTGLAKRIEPVRVGGDLAPILPD